MANDLSLPSSFGKLPTHIAGLAINNDDLSSGVASSYGVVGYRGKVWSIKFGGEETQLMRDDGDGPRGSIEVILVRASPAISKIFYKNGWVDGSNAAPDCWSGNGVAPDASVQNKVSPTCATCPMNAWGSRTTEAGKQAKACADSRRVAVVPLADIQNEMTGGPMLLRVPAASLKDMKGYADLLTSFQFPYYAAATRIGFDANESFPKFVFSAIRPLTKEELEQVVALRDDPRVSQVLAEKIDGSVAGAVPEAAKPVPASPFEQPVTAPSNPAPEAPKAAATKPKPPAKPKAETAAEVKTEVKAAPAEPTAAEKLAAARAKAAAAAKAAADAELAELEAAAAAEAAPKSAAELLTEGDEAVEEIAAAENEPTMFDDLLENIIGD